MDAWRPRPDWGTVSRYVVLVFFAFIAVVFWLASLGGRKVAVVAGEAPQLPGGGGPQPADGTALSSPTEAPGSPEIP